MFARYLQYLLTDFRQTFVTGGASWDTDDLITFLGQKVKVQGHTIAAEAHSTRHYRRVQLFLVSVCHRFSSVCFIDVHCYVKLFDQVSAFIQTSMVCCRQHILPCCFISVHYSLLFPCRIQC